MIKGLFAYDPFGPALSSAVVRIFLTASGLYTIRVPSLMDMILVIILVLNEWHRSDELSWANRFAHLRSNSAALEFPETAAELQLKDVNPNRQMVRSMVLGAFAIFCFVMVRSISLFSLVR